MRFHAPAGDLEIIGSPSNNAVTESFCNPRWEKSEECTGIDQTFELDATEGRGQILREGKFNVDYRAVYSFDRYIRVFSTHGRKRSFDLRWVPVSRGGS